MLRRSLILAVALAAVFTLAASAATPAPSFPVTVHAANGDIVVKQRPVRIVSLSPSATEDLYAVGAGSQVSRSTTSRTTRAGAAHEAVRLHAERRGDRGVQPGPRRDLERRRARRLAREARDHRAARAGARQRRAGLRRDPPDRPGDRPRGRGDEGRARDGEDAHVAHPQRAEEVAAPEGVPRAEPGLLLRDVVDVHRHGSTSCSGSATSPTRPTRRTPAIRSSRPSTSSRPIPTSSCSPTACAAGSRAKTVAARPGWSNVSAVKTHRVIAVDDTSRRAGGRGSSTSSRAIAKRRPAGVVIAASGAGGTSARAACLAAWARLRRRLPRRLAARRARASARSGSAPGRSSRRRSRTCRSCTSTRRSPACTTRSSGSCARRASCSRRSSAGCSRSRARRTRASSATRSPTRTCSASPPAPASARRSRSRTGTAQSPASSSRSRRSSARRVARRPRLRARPLGRRRRAATGALVLAGVTVRAFLTAVQTFVQQQHTQTLQEVYTGSSAASRRAGWHDVARRAPYIGVSATRDPAPPARARRARARRRGGGEPRRQRRGACG